MSYKAYVIIDSPAEKTANIVSTLLKKPGVVSVDLVEDSPQLIVVVEARGRRKLAELTVKPISAADSMATIMQLVTTTSG
jgi:nitrate reductase NapAB chaperone NapD